MNVVVRIHVKLFPFSTIPSPQTRCHFLNCIAIAIPSADNNYTVSRKSGPPTDSDNFVKT